MLEPEQETHAREIAESAAYDAARKFGRMILDELGSTPKRADGALNALDAYQAIERAVIRFEKGQP